MKREIIEKYKDRWIIVGVPHFYKENALFFYTGCLDSLNDEGIILKKESNELFLTYDRIRQVKASGSEAYDH